MPEDSPPGLLSLSHPVDITAWNQSVSQSQFSGKDLFPLDQEDFDEMANQFLDPNVLKDDVVSMTSSMDDSTYMSQPDTGRHGPRTLSRNQQHDSRRQTDVYASQIYSPALSSSSHGYHGGQSDVTQLFLPSNATELDFGEGAFSEFANYPSQGYGPHISYNIPSTSTSRQPDDNQSVWTADAQNFSRPFAVATIDAVAFQNELSARDFARPSLASSNMSQYGATASRPQMRRINTATSAQSGLSQRRSSVDNDSDMAPQSAVTQHSVGFIGPQFIDRSALQSPASGSEDRKPVLPASVYRDEASATESLVSPDIYNEVDEEHYASSSGAGAASEEADVKRARSHHLYSAAPGTDDMYHCPFKAESQCNHSATKLKCNYDKYVDSHLKPFRCKVADCVEVQFSSTACLLRHEREAHAMHGHGSKPHLCYFQGCERSFPGHGFPRRYNLFDHMKRVHDYVEQTPPERTATPPTSQTGSQRKSGGRKRKSTAGNEDQPEKRSRTGNNKSAMKMLPPQRQREQKLQQLHTQWNNYRQSLQQRLNSLQGPSDLATHQQIGDDFEMLQSLARQVTEMG